MHSRHWRRQGQNMDYNVVVSPRAQALLDRIIDYIVNQLKNPIAAMAVLDDIEEAYRILGSSAPAFRLSNDSYLAAKGYHKFTLKHHDYVLLYTIKDKEVQIAGIYHMRENYREKI